MADSKQVEFRELGVSGLRTRHGLIEEEFLTDLRGPKGRKVFRKMAETDPTIGALLFSIKQIIRSARWHSEPGGGSDLDREAASFLYSCINDMSSSWPTFISEACSMLEYGWAYFEIIWKKRLGRFAKPPSKYNDGRIGIRKLAIRGQNTLYKWQFDENGGIKGMWQLSGPIYKPIFIPITKSLLFRTDVQRGNPEGKALALGTPIPTPDGWKNIEDLAPGDAIYGADGKIHHVVARSPIWHDRPLFKVTFSTGQSLVADAKHIWRVTTFNDRNLKKEPRLLTTLELKERIEKRKKNPSFCVGPPPIIEGVKMILPVDPYIFGYWLGDGAVHSARIAMDKEDYPSLQRECERAGLSLSPWKNRGATVHGLFLKLRVAGLLHKKIIPPEFLRASFSQRLALLQGLMDSDGTSATGKDQASQWFNTDKALVDSVAELIRSLGGRPHVRINQHAGHSGGSPNGKPIFLRKDLYQISFYLPFPVHRLPRKLAKQSPKDSMRVRGYFIQSIEPVGYGDSVCIQVDSPTGCFLAGEGFIPTHNSILTSAYTAWYYLTHLKEIEAIGVERDLAGLPLLHAPVSIFTDSDKATLYQDLKDLVVNVRRDELEGLLLPYDPSAPESYKFELLSSGGKRQFSTSDIINRYKIEILQTVLADFISVGYGATGSYALIRTKRDLFELGVLGILDNIKGVLNSHLVPRLLEINPEFAGLKNYPTLEYSIAKIPQLDELSRLISALARAKVDISSNQDAINQVLSEAGLPPIRSSEPSPAKLSEVLNEDTPKT